MKEYGDNKRYVKESSINVLVKITRVKGQTYDEHPLTVMERKEGMITAQRREQRITQNSSFFKPSPAPPTIPTEQETASKCGNFETEDQPAPATTPAQTPIATRTAADQPKCNIKIPSCFKDFVMD